MNVGVQMGGVASVAVRRVELPFRDELLTGAGAIDRRTVFVVQVRGADGVVGVGEAAPLPSAGTGTVEECAAALEGLAATLRAGRRPSEPAAAAAVDLALHDLAARRLGVPLAGLLGVDAAKVDANALVTDLASAIAAVDAGFGTLKLKVGAEPIDADLRRLWDVRAAVGPRIRLRLDANGAWTVPEAIAALGRVAGVGIEYVEEPVPGAEGLAAVRRAVDVPVAPDESAVDLASARALLDAGAADLLVLKPMRLGGIEPTLAVARLAAERGVDCVVTGFLGGAVERAGASHLAAVVDAGNRERRAHGIAAGGLLAEDLGEGLAVVDGAALLRGPGHGVTVTR